MLNSNTHNLTKRQTEILLDLQSSKIVFNKLSQKAIYVRKNGMTSKIHPKTFRAFIQLGILAVTSDDKFRSEYCLSELGYMLYGKYFNDKGSLVKISGVAND